MKKEVSAMELQRKLSEFLDGVYRNGDRVIVKNANKPLAAIVSIEVYERMFKQREKPFLVLEKIWEKVPAVSEEQAQTDIEQAITEVRTENTK